VGNVKRKDNCEQKRKTTCTIVSMQQQEQKVLVLRQNNQIQQMFQSFYKKSKS
jgi:hypothetical protein